MRNIEKRIGSLETRERNSTPVLIAVSPKETNKEALGRSGLDKASLEGRQIIYVHTGVPRPTDHQQSSANISLPSLGDIT